MQDRVVTEVLSLSLVNAQDLLRLDLEGVNVILPPLINALEAVLCEREVRLRPSNVHKNELRRAAVNILLSTLALPSHFGDLPLKSLNSNEALSFKDLSGKIANVLISALQVETEAWNTHALLGRDHC